MRTGCLSREADLGAFVCLEGGPVHRVGDVFLHAIVPWTPRARSLLPSPGENRVRLTSTFESCGSDRREFDVDPHFYVEKFAEKNGHSL